MSSIAVAVGVIAISLLMYVVLHDPPETAASATGDATQAPSQDPTPAVTPEPSDEPTQSPSTTPTEAVGPTYAFPVQPSTAATYGPDHEAFPATDIYAPIGTDFVAVTSGVVDEVQKKDLWFPGNRDPNQRNGIYIAYIGDDGVRYFGSHLSMVAPGIRDGGRVEAGQLLGRIGRTGKERPGPSYVHFGISHPTRPGDWEIRRGEINPFRYLRAWEAGRSKTPKLP